MFSRVWNFVKRHKKKFVFTGVVVGGVVFLGHYARRRLQEYQESEAAECLSKARRQHHFDNNQRTCNMTVLSMLPNLRTSLMQALDAENITSQLKSKPSNKLELWEELKIISFTRTIVAVYGCCMLILMLRVQLNIIGGYMYIDSKLEQDSQNSECQKTSPKVQQKYLGKIEYILNQGVTDLIKVVKSAVEQVLASVPLTQKLSLHEIDDILQAIRRQVEHCNEIHDDTMSTHLAKFMVPPENHKDLKSGTLSSEDMLLDNLDMETRDIIESRDFDVILSLCLDTSFARLLDKTTEYFKPQDLNQSNEFVNPNDISMAMAKVIPIMTGLVHTVTGDPPNPIVQELLLKEQVKDFAANVYEAFSQPGAG